MFSLFFVFSFGSKLTQGCLVKNMFIEAISDTISDLSEYDNRKRHTYINIVCNISDICPLSFEIWVQEEETVWICCSVTILEEVQFRVRHSAGIISHFLVWWSHNFYGSSVSTSGVILDHMLLWLGLIYKWSAHHALEKYKQWHNLYQ